MGTIPRVPESPGFGRSIALGTAGRAPPELSGQDFDQAGPEETDKERIEREANERSRRSAPENVPGDDQRNETYDLHDSDGCFRLHGHAETPIIPEGHSPTASEDGESSLVGQQHEPRQLPAGAGAETPVGKGATGFRRKRGRKRAMPRDPFLSAARRYLDDLRPFRAPLTLEQLRRDLRTIARDLWHLRREGKLANVRPEAINEEDVSALLLYWRTRPTRYGRPMDPTSQAHLFRALKTFLEWSGNGVVVRMKAQGHVRFPRTIEKPIEVLDAEDLRRLREGAERLDGWSGAVARFLAGFLPATGLRPKEVRLARLADLDMARARLLVSHPKGEGSWAAPDYAPVLPFAREAVADFLAAREAYLGGEPCEALIPYRRVSGDLGPWSEAMLRKLKAEMERASGVRFHLRTLRPTFAQTAKDAGVPIEAVSRALRHGSTRTTEAYYARMRGEDAFREIERAFARPVVKVEPEWR